MLSEIPMDFFRRRRADKEPDVPAPRDKAEAGIPLEVKALLIPEAQEPSPPVLELREVGRSSSPINELQYGLKKGIQVLEPWDQYTLVFIEGFWSFQIYDENLQKVEELPEGAGLAFEISLRRILETRRARSLLAENPGRSPEYLSPPEMPPLLRRYTSNFIRLNGSGLQVNHSGLGRTDVTLKPSFARVTEGGKYVLFFGDPPELVAAFSTQNEGGIAQAPRNWKRIPLEEENLPQELIDDVEKGFRVLEGFEQINDTYTARINEVGVNICKNDDLYAPPVFTDRLPGVRKDIKNNLSVDPINPSAIYYCQFVSPEGIFRLDVSGSEETWQTQLARFPKRYESVENFQLDPSGSLFVFNAGTDLVFLAKDTLEEVKRVPDLGLVRFGDQGMMRAIGQGGYLFNYELNADAFVQASRKRRVEQLGQGISITDIFSQEAATRGVARQSSAQSMEHLLPLRARYGEEFATILGNASTREGVLRLRRGFTTLEQALRAQGLSVNETIFILSGLESQVEEKEKEFASREVDGILLSVRQIIDQGISLESIFRAREAMVRASDIEVLLTSDKRQEVRMLLEELTQRSSELFRQRGSEIIQDARNLLQGVEGEIQGFTSKLQFDEWLEFRFPQLKSRLGALLRDCPLEAQDAYHGLVETRDKLQSLADTSEERFQREYAQVRERAVEHREALADSLRRDIEGLVGRLRARAFQNRDAAQQYLDASEAKKILEADIQAFAAQSPDISRELMRSLNVNLSNALYEIERGALSSVQATGEQMVLLGDAPFPKWEAKVKEKGERRVDMSFEADAKTQGPGVAPREVRGDVTLSIASPEGKTQKARLYEGTPREDELRMGLLSYRGFSLPPSYVTGEEFRLIRKDYGEWTRGERSSLRQDLDKKKEELRALYQQRQKVGSREASIDEEWKQAYQAKLAEYGQFYADHHVALLKRIDEVREEPGIEYSNGKGEVMKWENHWIKDAQTDYYLGEIARLFKMQLDLQEGILDLKGHAGAGKDVLLSMFSALTGRPYFPVDCTKWTTEFELSQDVSLDVKEGVSVTVRDDSTVLAGIQTPGAIVYFNEFNAMPHAAQIFLHRLTSESRSLTLKTSSGKVVRADPTVLLAASENPNYPETFDPQFATRSRMVSLEIAYPPLTREKDANDPNPNPPYNASEALRIARGLDSLVALTYEANLEHNEFVRMWDRYVNGIENGTSEPTQTQKFDIDVILALVEFGARLRQDFIKIFEKSPQMRTALPVTQPLTGREFRRCAYALNAMPAEEKVTGNPEAAARQLLERFFLTNIDRQEDREKIKTAMASWTSQKRIGI